MKRMTVLGVILLLSLGIMGCADDKENQAPGQSSESNNQSGEEAGSGTMAETITEPEPTPSVVTADIQAGIEKYIADQTKLQGGYFELPYEGKTLQLKLVRVHTEYLANLGPEEHFACVDLVTVDGDIYDVDFFMAGEVGDMTVTETTAHKHNGQPFYTWEQDQEEVWQRVAMENASPGHLGVVYGNDEFEFLYRLVVPELTDDARMWLPIPETDSFQTVELISLKAPGEHQFLNDRDHKNKVLFLELEPADSGQSVEIRYSVQRREKACYAESVNDLKKYLEPTSQEPGSDRFKKEATPVVAGKSSDLIKARALYDYVIDEMKYIKFGEGWGQGDAVHACDSGTGNCTDFHSYFIALARSVDIPARFAIGAAIPSSRNEGRINGYHCWAEFYADGKWWPVDISEGDKYSSLATYYFGHHPANRVELSRGRDLVVNPGPAAGSINFLAYPVLEVDGKPVRAAVEFSFTRDDAASAGNSDS